MKIAFWGTPTFGLPAFRALAREGLVSYVVSRPDKPRGRSGHPQPSPIKAAAKDLGLPVLTPEKINADFLLELKSLERVTFLVVAYGRIIPTECLVLSALPAINIHPSLLPVLRGPSPIQTALLQGHAVTGLTLMQLDEEMDHGPILAQKKVAIDSHDDYTHLEEKLSLAAAQFIVKYVPKYFEGSLSPHAQDHSLATYCRLLTKEDGRLNLDESAQINYNKIRALKGWPGAFIVWQERRLGILRASVVKTESAGAIFSSDRDERLIIKCQSGALAVSELQLEGKRPMSSADFLRGHPGILG